MRKIKETAVKEMSINSSIKKNFLGGIILIEKIICKGYDPMKIRPIVQSLNHPKEI